MHGKNRNSLLNLLINCISGRSAPQILSLKDNYIFRFSSFLITGLCNSVANSWFGISSLITPLPPTLFARVAENVLSKNL